MRIVFLGDSLTLGLPGSSYFSLLKNRIGNHDLVKLGVGGDTVISLYRRITTKTFAETGDIAVVAIGLNDVFVKVAPHYPFIKTLVRQQWANSHREFEEYYRKILEVLEARFERTITVSITFLGEDLTNRFNAEIDQLNDIIRRMTDENPNMTYLDIKQKMVNRLDGKEISPYLPDNAMRVVLDGLFLRSATRITKASRRRGLHLTLDGVHLNPEGAQLWAEAIFACLAVVFESAWPLPSIFRSRFPHMIPDLGHISSSEPGG